MSNDRMTNADFSDLGDLLETNFSGLARLHDAILKTACDYWSNNAKEANATASSLALHHSRKADVVKTVMKFRFPEASDDWFA